MDSQEVAVEVTSYPRVSRDVQAAHNVFDMLKMEANPGMLAAVVDM